jgi:hypothetical protein
VKKHLMTLVLALIVGVLGFAVSGIATAGNGNPNPPGQPDCDHGNGGQSGNAGECKQDPSENGKDCDPHGKNGGQNEDHCTTETTPTETTPTETTPTETTPTDTTPTETTPTDTTPTDTTPQGTTPQETTPSGSSTPPATTPQETTPEESSQPPASSPESPKTPSIVGTPPKAQHNPAKVSPAKTAVHGVSAKTAPKPTRKAQPAPFTL